MDVTRATEATPPVPYAGFVTRTLAISVDVLTINVSLAVFGSVVGLALSLFGDTLEADFQTLLAGAACWVIVTTIYFTSFWSLAGETPGMRLMGLRIVSMRGDRVGLRQCLRRLIGMALSALMLMMGFFLILIDDRRQGFHDKLARTFVVYSEEPEDAFVATEEEEGAGQAARSATNSETLVPSRPRSS